MDKTRFIKLTVYSADQRQPQPGYNTSDWGNSLGQYAPEHFIAIINGTPYINTGLLTTLTDNGASRAYRPSYTYGRNRLYKVTKDVQDEILRHATYPARNANEAWTRERNLNIAAYIESLQA